MFISGVQFATRLMVIRGGFECVTLAIYGELVADISAPTTAYTPRNLPPIECLPLSRSLDPSNCSDPTLISRQLLQLIPGSPSLPLVIRLMLCLKASNDDWERPEFPYLYADLGTDGEFSLENAYRRTMTPVDDESNLDYLENFAIAVAGCIGPKVRIILNLSSRLASSAA
jgi:hypothetical protein